MSVHQPHAEGLRDMREREEKEEKAVRRQRGYAGNNHMSVYIGLQMY